MIEDEFIKVMNCLEFLIGEVAANMNIFILIFVSEIMSLEDFKVLEKLGAGAYSSVYKVRRIQDNQIYALKKIQYMDLNQKQKQNSLNEIRILASICHENIIGYRQAFFDNESRSLCIIMQYADNGDLFQRITTKIKAKQTFEQQQIWNLFISLVRGLKLLHDKNIFHRDLKSANVFLFRNKKVKLGDMNVSKISEKGLCQTQTGTPYYASPQVWKDQPYGLKSDIWSLGCVLYEIIALHPPFQAQDMQGLYKIVTKGIYPRLSSKYSSDLSDLVRMLLQTDPCKRPSCDKILKSKIILKRFDKNKFYQSVENPQFLKTIKHPTDTILFEQNLPKSNYLKSEKEYQIVNREKKARNNTQSQNQNLFPQMRKQRRYMLINKSVMIKNAPILEAARSHLAQNEAKILRHINSSAKKHNQKSLPYIRKRQISGSWNNEEKLNQMKKIYRQPYRNKKNQK